MRIQIRSSQDRRTLLKFVVKITKSMKEKGKIVNPFRYIVLDPDPEALKCQILRKMFTIVFRILILYAGPC
jgi:hypothetical protein